MPAQFLAFLSVSLLVIVTPGPDTALVIRNTLLGGRRGGILTSLGVATGQACWTFAASAGVAALLVTLAPAFLAVKLAGAAYLIFLGVQTLRSALRRQTVLAAAPHSAPVRRDALPYRQGLISNLGNPKMAVFFTSLLPAFTSPGEATFGTLLGLGLVFCALTLTWLSGYAFVIGRAGRLLRRPRVRRALDALTGTVLIALGLRLATEPR